MCLRLLTLFLIKETLCHVLADVNEEDLTKHIYKFFRPGTVYDLPLNDPSRQKGGTVPVYLLCKWGLCDVHMYQSST